MRNKGKVLVLMLSAAALVAASVFGTMAYLTDNESVTNTFTVGRVGLDLDEAPVDENGDATTGKRVKENEYRLLPGHEYDKDPTVHIDADSESCWVFVKVTNEISAIEWNDDQTYTNVTGQINANGWEQLMNDTTPVENVYYMKWDKNNTAGDNGATKYDLPVFENFKIDGADVQYYKQGETVPTGKYNLAFYEGKKIVVTAYAVQFDGFNSAEKTDMQNAYAAWDAADFE